MKIVYQVRFDNGGVTISQEINPDGSADPGGGGQDPIGGGGQDASGGGGQDPIGGGGQDPIGGGGQDPIGGGGGNGRQIAVIFGPVVIGSSNAAPLQAGSPRKIPRNMPETKLEDVFGPVPKLAGVAVKAPARRPKPFRMLCQAFTNWCWAAVAGAVRDEPQCDIASQVLDSECCDNGVSCNYEASLETALGDRLLKLCQGTVDFDLIRHEIDAGRVLCARVAWDADRDLIEDRGHFVAISGYRLRKDPAGTETPYLVVQDPDGGRSRRLGRAAEAVSTEISFEDFKTRYKSVGVWTHTYILRDPPAAGSDLR